MPGKGRVTPRMGVTAVPTDTTVPLILGVAGYILKVEEDEESGYEEEEEQ